jgi:hypothetical protein
MCGRGRLGNHQVVAGVDVPDPAAGPGHAGRVPAGERRRAHDVRLRDRRHRGLVGQHQRLGEAPERVGREPGLHPGDVVGVGHAVVRQRLGPGEQHQLDAADHLGPAAGRGHERGGQLGQRLAVHRGRRVEVDEVADAVRRPIGDAGDHHAAVAVADQDHVPQVLVVEHRHHVPDVGVEVDLRAQQVRPLPQSGQRRGEHLVTRRPQPRRHPAVAPAAVGSTVDQDVRRHHVVTIETPAVPGAP